MAKVQQPTDIGETMEAVPLETLTQALAGDGEFQPMAYSGGWQAIRHSEPHHRDDEDLSEPSQRFGSAPLTHIFPR